MRKIFCTTTILISACLFQTTAHAQSNTVDQNGVPIIVPNTSSSYNQQGFALPTAPRASGQDVIRGSGGISCQSAISGNGPVVDLGVIGTNDIFDRDSSALYGRITIPLGKKAKRVDCNKLYDLEIERLKMELSLLRAGTVGGPGGGLFDQQAAQQLITQADRSGFGQPKVAKVAEVEEEAIPTFQLGGPAPAKAAPTPKPQTFAARPASPISETPSASLPVTTAYRAPEPMPVAIAPRPASKPAAKPAAPLPKRVAIHVTGQPGAAMDKDNCNYYSQMGAFSSMANVEKAWKTLQVEFPEGLDHFEAVAKPVNRKGKTLYLLQAGPFTRSTAGDICKSVGGGCYAFRT